MLSRRVARLALSSLLFSQAHGLRLYPALSTTRLRGGSSSFAMSATATVETAPAAPVEKFRLEYAAPPYVIDTVHLDFNIAEEETLVKTRLEIKRGAGVADGTPMVLDGDAEAVKLREITLDGAALVEAEDYTLTDETVTLLRPPAGASFTLRTTVAIKPQELPLPLPLPLTPPPPPPRALALALPLPLARRTCSSRGCTSRAATSSPSARRRASAASPSSR